jgi:cysteine synthase A
VSVVLVHVVNPQSFHWTMDLAVPWLRLLALCAGRGGGRHRHRLAGRAGGGRARRGAGRQGRLVAAPSPGPACDNARHAQPPHLRAWEHDAIARIEADFQRSADTHLIALPLPGFARARHRPVPEGRIHPPHGQPEAPAGALAVPVCLCNGWLHEGTTVVEASSGSTAVSEAYFARLLGLPFVAVMPRSTSPEKIAQIEFYGGRCHLVDSAAQVYDEARAVAAATGGHYMDQFTYAERATDWRGNNNIAQSMFPDGARAHPVPRWVVVGAGTGGTSATIGRYIRYQQLATELCVADPQGSVFRLPRQRATPASPARARASRASAGPRVEPSFIRTLVDRMVVVSDADSVAAMRVLSGLLGRRVGPSTGTNFTAMLRWPRHARAR